MNIFLIGYRGSGKTTVARRLATEIGWDWLDADVELERRVGQSIRQIFADQGERAFREYESTVLADLVAHDRQAIALGGGAILRDQNRVALGGRGPVVWLRGSPETLYDRIRADGTTAERRPNLTAQGGLDEIRRLVELRAPIYRACANLTLDVDRQSPDELARAIADYYLALRGPA